MALSFEHDGKKFCNCSIEYLLAAGVPQTVLDIQLAAEHQILVKAECRRRIYAVASQEAQQNMNLRAAVIGAKAEADRSAEEQADLAAAAAAHAWVSGMRSAAQSLAADASADFTADASWPVCPPEAVALADSM